MRTTGKNTKTTRHSAPSQARALAGGVRGRRGSGMDNRGRTFAANRENSRENHVIDSLLTYNHPAAEKQIGIVAPRGLPSSNHHHSCATQAPSARILETTSGLQR